MIGFLRRRGLVLLEVTSTPKNIDLTHNWIEEIARIAPAFAAHKSSLCRRLTSST
jgi:hypothetical protein